jgi:hypothetical protein
MFGTRTRVKGLFRRILTKTAHLSKKHVYLCSTIPTRLRAGQPMNEVSIPGRCERLFLWALKYSQPHSWGFGSSGIRLCLSE